MKAIAVAGWLLGMSLGCGTVYLFGAGTGYLKAELILLPLGVIVLGYDLDRRGQR